MHEPPGGTESAWSSRPEEGTLQFMSISASRFAPPVCLFATLVLTAGGFAQMASPAAKPAAPAAPSTSDKPATKDTPDTAGSYYHYMLAHEYEEMATTFGRSEYANQAIEQYKMALDDDPTSKYLNSHLADLYFKTGHIREAIVAAQERVKQDPTDLDAHKLLAEVYLRSLGDGQQGDVSAQMLKLAIGEYQTIVKLEPNSADDHLMLARLYAADHQGPQAEGELAAARKIDPASEETALIANRFYTDEGQMQRAVDVLKSLPDDDQTSRTEYQLGMTYDQMKDGKNAIDAYKKALELEPDNLDVERALAADLDRRQSDGCGADRVEGHCGRRSDRPRSVVAGSGD